MVFKARSQFYFLYRQKDLHRYFPMTMQKTIECSLPSQSEGVTSVPAVSCMCTCPTFSQSVVMSAASLNLAARSWIQQEAQLMLTNPRDAFSSQSRSPNIVPFNILGIVSCCAIVTLSSRGAVFTIFDFKKCRDLEIGVRGHSRSLKVAPFERLCMVSY